MVWRSTLKPLALVTPILPPIVPLYPTIALLMAPDSGEKMRVQLRDRGQGFMNEVRHAADSRRIELRGRLETLRAPKEVNL